MKKQIDLNKKKTEHEWLKSSDDFFLKNTTHWFTFLNWLILLGLFHHLAEVTKDIFVISIYIISTILMWSYIQSFFYTIEVKGIPFFKKEKYKRIATILISGVTATSIMFMMNKAVPKISSLV